MDSERFRQAVGFDLNQETEAYQQLNEFERAVVRILLSREAFNQESGINARVINDRIEANTDIAFDRHHALDSAVRGNRLPQFVSRAQGGRGASASYWLTMTSATRSGVSPFESLIQRTSPISVADAILRP